MAGRRKLRFSTRVLNRLRSVRVRLWAVLAVAVLVTLGVTGTYAYWTDSATVSTGPLGSGKLDLKVGASTADQLTEPGGTWTYDAFAIADLLPGESVAASFVVGNGGSTPLKYTGTVATSNNELYNTTTPGLQVTVTTGGTAGNTGSQSTGNRTGSCSGGTATQVTNANVSTTMAQINASAITLMPAGKTTYCVVAKLATTSPTTMQGKSVVLQFVFEATQPS
jgi:predicted ribosomally synthesized peptide with SipW-like signal peptide